MRLLNVDSLALQSFEDERKAPSYAILSHTWGDQEVSIDDIGGPRFTEDVKSQSVWKILRCAEQAKKDGLDWIWVDTCCIQKSSSAELSEAINSMFRWYKRSAVCYAFLNDVPSLPENPTTLQHNHWHNKFAASRWFTRGWTLQEMIAPQSLTFFSHDWHFIGTKRSLVVPVSQITDVPTDTLLSGDAFGQPMARRMSWAAKRQTTRVEDMSYCLLGIFNIHMPLLYGEGERAFQRLQEEIVKMTDDETIFAWRAASSTYATWRSLFAASPAEFEHSGSFVPITGIHSPQSHTITNKGLQMRLPLLESHFAEKQWKSGTEHVAVLKCRYVPAGRLHHTYPLAGIFVKRIFHDEYVRVDATRTCSLTLSDYPTVPRSFTHVAVKQMVDYSPWLHLFKCFRIAGIWLTCSLPAAIVTKVRPRAQWNPSTQMLRFDEAQLRRGQSQYVHCYLQRASSSVILELAFHPQAVYRGACCAYKFVTGSLDVAVESYVRVIDGEAMLAVNLKPLGMIGNRFAPERLGEVVVQRRRSTSQLLI